jgi:hypothetical protein
MMNEERHPADSHSLWRLAEKMRDKEYRDAYVDGHTRQVLARQMREFRGDQSQTEFGEILGKKQTVVSRLEDASYSGWSLRTILEVAAKVNVAVFVRFVDFPTFLKYSQDLSDDALHPRPYNDQAIEALLARESALNKPQGALRAFLTASYEGQKQGALANAANAQPSPVPSNNSQPTGVMAKEIAAMFDAVSEQHFPEEPMASAG